MIFNCSSSSAPLRFASLESFLEFCRPWSRDCIWVMVIHPIMRMYDPYQQIQLLTNGTRKSAVVDWQWVFPCYQRNQPPNGDRRLKGLVDKLPKVTLQVLGNHAVHQISHKRRGLLRLRHWGCHLAWLERLQKILHNAVFSDWGFRCGFLGRLVLGLREFEVRLLRNTKRLSQPRYLSMSKDSGLNTIVTFGASRSKHQWKCQAIPNLPRHRDAYIELHVVTVEAIVVEVLDCGPRQESPANLYKVYVLSSGPTKVHKERFLKQYFSWPTRLRQHLHSQFDLYPICLYPVNPTGISTMTMSNSKSSKIPRDRVAWTGTPANHEVSWQFMQQI